MMNSRWIFGYLRTARCLTTLLLACTSTTVFAAWKSVGPFGGASEAIVVDANNPDLLVAATRNGLVYRSTDAGMQWAPVYFPHALAATVHVMKASSGEAPVYYLGIDAESALSTGLYRSVDRGESWQPVEGLRGESVLSLVIWAKDPMVIAAGCKNGVFMTRDGGASWKRISPAENNELQAVTSINMDPANSEVIYAGTSHLPWKTSNGGKIWQSIHAGMIDDSDVFSVEVDPSNPKRIYASACSGIYTSLSAGALWSKMQGVPRTSRRTYTIRVDPMHTEVVYAGTSQGLWKSSDHGASWRQISDLIVKSIAFDPRDSRHLYLATENAGIVMSADGAESTKRMNNGFVNRSLTALAADGQDIYTTSLYDFLNTGVYRMTVPDGDWSRLGRPATGQTGNVLAVVPIDTDRLMAFTYDGMVRSTDKGATWSFLSTSWKGARVNALRAIHADPAVILVGTSEGLYRSEDMGTKWTKVMDETLPTEAIFAAPAPGKTAVAETSKGLFVSRDAGHQWMPIPSPAPNAEIYDMAISTEGVLVVGTAHGAFRSTDYGQNWERITGGLTSGTVRVVSFHPTLPTAFAVQNGIVYHSADAGANWSALDMHGMEHASIRSLLVTIAAPDWIFAQTHARGVFISPLPGASAGLTPFSDSPGRRSRLVVPASSSPPLKNHRSN